MHITLISPYQDITSFGLRTISAHLQRHGHRTRLVFLPDPFGDDLQYGVKRYEDCVLDQLVELCRGTDLVGLTLMTNFFDGAVEVTRHLKAASGTPVIWGGVHPTIRPEESLEHADMVCVGDGEDAVLELLDKMAAGRDWTDTANIWTKRDGAIVRNPPRPLSRDLDAYLRPDYSLEDHHILCDGRLQPLTGELQKRFMQRGPLFHYQTMTGRGCPHRCTYCINDALRTLYGKAGYLRWRSTAHVIDELLWVKQNLPYVGFLEISDDSFFARPGTAIEEFCREYKQKIALPFACLASPLTVTEEKMAALVDAGLVHVQMGIQTGSSHIQELFNRKSMTNERVMRAIRSINAHKNRIVKPSYDFILDVPYETDQDVVESLRLIAAIPKPFRLQPFALVLYPGTKLHEMAIRDGLVGDERREIYAKSYAMRQGNYLNLLITLARGGRFPGPLLKLLVSDPFVAVLNSRPLKPLFRLLFRAQRAVKRARRRP